MAKQKSSGWLDQFISKVPNTIGTNTIASSDATYQPNPGPVFLGNPYTKEMAKRQTYLNPQGVSAAPAMKQAALDRAQSEKTSDLNKKIATYAQNIGGALELAAPFTGPAMPILGAVGTGLDVGGSAYLAGKDISEGNYGSAAMNAGFGTLGAAGFVPMVKYNRGLNAAVNTVDDVSDVSGLYNSYDNLGREYAGTVRNAKNEIIPNKQIMSSTGNFFKELSDKILPREIPVQQSIDAGNQWTKDWISHPATQEKMMRDFDIMDQTAPWASHNYKQHSLNYKPNSALFPLSEQAKELGQLIWKGETSSGAESMIHSDNMGISYRHPRSPLEDARLASIHPRYGTWISRNPKYSHSQIKSTVGHENYHDWLREPLLVQSGQFHDIQNAIKPEPLIHYNNWQTLRQSGKSSDEINKIMGEENAYIGYLADPTEVHARIGELRQKYKLTPNQMITSKDIQNMRGGEGLPGNVVNRRFFDMFKNDANAARMFNRLWAAPAAVGVGAAAVANQQEYNDGGPIQPNYNDASVSMSADFVGDGYNTKGRNYSPAWGGQFAMGGSMPGAVGFTYARTGSIPSNGPYAKKTKASAQDGTLLDKGINKLYNAEDRLTKWLGNPMQRATNEAKSASYDYLGSNDDPIDSYRHSMAGNYTSKAIQDKLYNIPLVSQAAGFIGANALGLGHEISTLVGHAPMFGGDDDRPFLDKLKESGEDAFNNMVGAGVGSIPFMSAKQKSKALLNMSLNNRLPDGHGQGNMYIKKKQNGGEMKYYQEGLDFKPKTISKNGSELKKLDQLTNFTNYNPTKPSGWLEKYQ